MVLRIRETLGFFLLPGDMVGGSAPSPPMGFRLSGSPGRGSSFRCEAPNISWTSKLTPKSGSPGPGGGGPPGLPQTEQTFRILFIKEEFFYVFFRPPKYFLVPKFVFDALFGHKVDFLGIQTNPPQNATKQSVLFFRTLFVSLIFLILLFPRFIWCVPSFVNLDCPS